MSYDYKNNFPNDEPTIIDELGRVEVSHELARISLFCNAPMVIGIYGPWGSGKSSFMEFIRCAIGDQNNLIKDSGQTFVKVKTVKFNPWEAQFVEQPAVALIEKIALDCGIYEDPQIKEKIFGISRKMIRRVVGIGARVASAATAYMPKIAPIIKEGFEVIKDACEPEEKVPDNLNSLDIQKEFKELIDKSMKKDAINEADRIDRLVIFIDDLDRCMHEQTLQLLEALKLYLNHSGCVYVIGADPEAIKASIEHHYRDSTNPIKGEDYLDKIIQIPFRLPGVARKEKGEYITNLLGDDLMRCIELMMAGLGDSPRNLKRFSLLLKMNYRAGCTYKGYKPETAALFLLIQWISENNKKQKKLDLFSKITMDRQEMLRLVERSKNGEDKRKEILGDEKKLTKIFEIAMDSANVPRDLAEVDLYIHLARQVGGCDEEDVDETIRQVNLKVVIAEHKEWLLSGGTRGKQARLLREQYAKKDLKKLGNINLLKGVNLSRAYLYGIFMEYSNLTGAILYDAVMEEAALSRITLTGADLRMVNLKGADLKEAKMGGADLTMANLSKADLTKATLHKAILFGADFKGAELCGADLTGADLTNANLLGANLDGTILSGCDLKGAYLAEVKNLSKAVGFDKALNNDKCTLPTDVATL